MEVLLLQDSLARSSVLSQHSGVWLDKCFCKASNSLFFIITTQPMVIVTTISTMPFIYTSSKACATMIGISAALKKEEFLENNFIREVDRRNCDEYYYYEVIHRVKRKDDDCGSIKRDVI